MEPQKTDITQSTTITSTGNNIGDKIIKKLLDRFLLPIIAIVFIIILLTINITFIIATPSVLSKDTWVGILFSLISAIFGILNITTYSMFDPESKHKDKFKVFIVFNFIAVIALAIVNITSHLWFLVFENIMFGLSGIYQYYIWFIKEAEENNTDNKIGMHYVSWSSKIAKLLYLILPIVMLLSVLVSLEVSVLVLDTSWKTLTTQAIIGGVVDGIAFTLSLTAAILIAKKITNSQWLYLIGDTILILWWGYLLIAAFSGNGLSGNDNVDKLTALNIVTLFSFYLSSNIINIKRWKE